MLGADLIGFHTYDYERHFLSSVRRILHLNVNFNLIQHAEIEKLWSILFRWELIMKSLKTQHV